MTLSNMGEDDQTETLLSTPRFPYLPLPAATTMLSPEHPSGMATPPLQTLASVPFKWEEQPGKPRSCTDIVVRSEPAKCLELPPCRILFMEPASKTNRMPSPTTVLDGPYINVGRSKFSSFRLFREARGGSSDSGGGGSPHSSVDILLAKKKARRFFGGISRVKSGKKEVDCGDFEFSPSIIGHDSAERGSRVKMEGKMRRNGSFSGLSQAASTHLWVTICDSLKKATPWRSARKS